MIEFLFSANKGSRFQPIREVASGGELSRLTLCTKSLVAAAIPLPTLIFDEIDTGTGGAVALQDFRVAFLAVAAVLVEGSGPGIAELRAGQLAAARAGFESVVRADPERMDALNHEMLMDYVTIYDILQLS